MSPCFRCPALYRERRPHHWWLPAIDEMFAGVWLLEPTPKTLDFMRSVVNQVIYAAPWQWEQAAWNEVVMWFVWAMGSNGQLRYRMLPVESFSNISEWLKAC